MRYNHVVTVVTNGTLSKQVDKLIDIEESAVRNLIFKASLHYLELKKKSMLKIYFENIRKVIQKGGSAYPSLVIANEYLPYLEEISEICMEELGNTPHCTPCMVCGNQYDIQHTLAVYPEITESLYQRVNNLFDSNVFKESVRFLNIDVQEHYCYAGKWSWIVDMGTGQVSKCHYVAAGKNFFEDIEKKFESNNPVACSCGISSCALQYNFFSLGIIPDVQGELQFGDLIYKEGLVSEFLRDKLNVNFAQMYGEDSTEEKYIKVLQGKNGQMNDVLGIYRWMKDYLKREGIDINLLQGNPFVQKRIQEAVYSKYLIGIYGMGREYKRYRFAIDFKVDFFVETEPGGEF